VTIAKRPSFERGMAEEIEVIWVKREGKNFFGEDWTGEISLKLKENFFSTRIPETRMIIAERSPDAAQRHQRVHARLRR